MQAAKILMRAPVDATRAPLQGILMPHDDDADSLCLFASEPLDRASEERIKPEWIAELLADPATTLVPLYRGDPLTIGEKAGFLSTAATPEFPRDAAVAFLGLDANRKAYFAIDASAAESPERAPLAELGRYAPLREAAMFLPERDLSIIGQARWLLEWHRRHRHCAQCGAPTEVADGGAKRLCPRCKAEHFPRTDPVAIVLAVHGDSCLLGRSPNFPPTFFSALAGFVEAAETPEAAAIRELREEAGIVLTSVSYQFSQPWPFPSSLMMGFIAEARDKSLKLDHREISEALWLSKSEVRALIAGERREDIRLPPRFAIARRLIDRWAAL
jgi:NAD+ diphosphatase